MTNRFRSILSIVIGVFWLVILAYGLLTACSYPGQEPNPIPAYHTPTSTGAPSDTPAAPTATQAPPVFTATIPSTPTPTAGPTRTPPPTPIIASDQIVNGGFESGTIKRSADQLVPLGWLAWGPGHVEIEQHASHVFEGSNSARVWQAYTTNPVGLYQVVDVLPNAWYEFSGWGYSWATNNPVVDTPSEAWVKMWIGIDPDGGTDPKSPAIVWSPDQAPRDVYGFFVVKAQARAPRITVWLKAAPDWGLARSDQFWDAFHVYQIALPAAPTPSIMTVTPTGAATYHARTGTLRALKTLNVRPCPFVADTCPAQGTIPMGQTARFFNVVTEAPSGDQWLCISYNVLMPMDCPAQVAYIVGGVQYCEVVYDLPPARLVGPVRAF